MSSLGRIFLVASLLVPTLPLFAAVTVTSPVNGITTTSPVTLTASASACSKQVITATGYSLDFGVTTILHNASINALVAVPLGAHTLHVKSWGNKDAVCVTDVAVKIVGGLVVPPGVVPTAVSSIQTLTKWKATHDAGTPGSATPYMALVQSPSLSGSALETISTFNGSGGVRYSVSFGDDTQATHFLYDGWLYIEGSAAEIANIEMDMNQVIANGDTVIYGGQCDGYSGTWDYTENIGTETQTKAHWLHSAVACSPHAWSVNVWHHVE